MAPEDNPQDEEANSFFVDIPNCHNLKSHWVNVAVFKTKAEAVAWIRKHIDQCDDDGKICLITE